MYLILLQMIDAMASDINSLNHTVIENFRSTVVCSSYLLVCMWKTSFHIFSKSYFCLLNICDGVCHLNGLAVSSEYNYPRWCDKVILSNNSDL